MGIEGISEEIRSGVWHNAKGNERENIKRKSLKSKFQIPLSASFVNSEKIWITIFHLLTFKLFVYFI